MSAESSRSISQPRFYRLRRPADPCRVHPPKPPERHSRALLSARGRKADAKSWGPNQTLPAASPKSQAPLPAPQLYHGEVLRGRTARADLAARGKSTFSKLGSLSRLLGASRDRQSDPACSWARAQLSPGFRRARRPKQARESSSCFQPGLKDVPTRFNKHREERTYQLIKPEFPKSSFFPPPPSPIPLSIVLSKLQANRPSIHTRQEEIMVGSVCPP